MSLPSVDDLLSGGGKSAKFPEIGTTYKGTIVSRKARQASDMSTGELKTWSNGGPVMEVVIQIQTTESDDDDDDGAAR